MKKKYLYCGFDIGTENCKIGPVDLVKNELITCDLGIPFLPNYVNLFEDDFETGVFAKSNLINNIGITFFNVKNLIGKSYEEAIKNDEVFFNIEEGLNGEILIPVFFEEKETYLTPTQLLAMVFSSLKKHAGDSEQISCVVSCPHYFTDYQRRELLNAASIANIDVEKILPDLSAISHNYFMKKNFSNEEKNNICAFIDIGASSTQCSIVKFDIKDKKLEHLVVEYDKNSGGNNLTKNIANYFIDKHSLKLSQNSKLRLMIECEKLKIKILDGDDVLLIKIQNLDKGKDFISSLSKKEFNVLCKDFFNRIETVLQRAIKKFEIINKTKLGIESKIDDVGLTGGCSKISEISVIVKKVFMKDELLNLDPDKSIAFGCASYILEYVSNFCKDKISIEEFHLFDIKTTYYHRFRPDLGKKTIDIFKKDTSSSFKDLVQVVCHELPMIFDLSYINEKGQSIEFCKIKVFSEKNIRFSQSELIFFLEIEKDGLFSIKNANESILVINKVKISSSINPYRILKKYSCKETKILKQEVVWIKGLMNEEKLEEFKNFQMKIDENNLFNKINLKAKLNKFIDFWCTKLRLKKFQKFLKEDIKKDFMNELEITKKKLLEDESENKLQSILYYDEKLNSLKENSFKLTKKILDNFSY